MKLASIFALLALPLCASLNAQQPVPRDTRPVYFYLALPRVGTRAPDFRYALVRGGTVTPGGLKGAPAVLVLWATWCGPCRQELRDVEALQASYAPRGVHVVILAEDSMPELRRFADSVRVRTPLAAAADLETYFDLSSMAPERDTLRVAFALPGVLVLDRHATVVYRDGGGAGAIKGVRETLDELLTTTPAR